MAFPEWAPDDLVDYYSELNKLGDEYPAAKEHQEIVYRLMTRPEMEKVWLWHSKSRPCVPPSANGGVVGSLLRAFEEFNSFAKASPSERVQDFAEIRKLASQLSVKLHKYRNERYANITNYKRLIPEKYDSPLIESLREDFKKNLADQRESGDRHFPYWNELLPPLATILENLSNAADSIDPNLMPTPAKIKQDGALSTYLIKHISFSASMGFVVIPSTHLATIVSVALDDPSINFDKARKVRQTIFRKYTKVNNK